MIHYLKCQVPEGFLMCMYISKSEMYVLKIDSTQRLFMRFSYWKWNSKFDSHVLNRFRFSNHMNFGMCSMNLPEAVCEKTLASIEMIVFHKIFGWCLSRFSSSEKEVRCSEGLTLTCATVVMKSMSLTVLESEANSVMNAITTGVRFSASYPILRMSSIVIQ